jgi:hypothetical protein
MDRVQGIVRNQLIVPGQSGPAPEGSLSAASPRALTSTAAASFATSFKYG